MDKSNYPRDLTPAERKQIFTNEAQTIMNWAGENFYKACGFPVVENEDGSGSSCVKRIDHPGIVHEDFEGKKRVDGEAYVETPEDVVFYLGHPYKVVDALVSTGAHLQYRYILTAVKE